jgi:flagellar biosynthesis/type III secretory pathway chaperone
VILVDRVPDNALDQLVAALDRELALLERRERQTDELRQAIIQADDVEMEALLDRMGEADREQSLVDAEVGSLRAAISAMLDPRAPTMKLSEMVKRLPPERSGGIERRRELIVRKIDDLRQLHVETAVLLAECARINRMLLDTMLRGSSTVITYDARGGHHRARSGGLLSAKL